MSKEDDPICKGPNYSRRSTLAMAVAVGAGAIVYKLDSLGLIRELHKLLEPSNLSPITEFGNSKEKYRQYAFDFYKHLLEKFADSNGHKEKKWIISHEASNWTLSRIIESELDLIATLKDPKQQEFVIDQHKRSLDQLKGYYNGEVSNGSSAQSFPSNFEAFGIEVKQYPKWEFSEKFNDDNIWNGLNAVREGDIQHAESIFDFVIRSWDEKEGGIYWKEQNEAEKNRYINTVTNAGALQLALKLYKTSGTEEKQHYYESWALKLFKWIEDNNLKDSDGLYFDGLGEKSKWPYNQGLMIENFNILSEIHRQFPSVASVFLDQAIDLANRSMDHYNTVLNENKKSSEYLDYINHPEFNAVYFKSLFNLYSKVNDEGFKNKITKIIFGYAMEVGTNNYDGRLKIYFFQNKTEPIKEFGMLQICTILGAEEKDYSKLF